MPRLKALVPAFLALTLLCQVGATPVGAQEPVNQTDDPVLKEFVWRAIGPASMGGRIDDVEGLPSDPSTLYLGFATGGIWKTTNMGTTWTPIFDSYPVSSIGDLAISLSNPDIIYVGSGESNNRQSTTSGNGVYKSTDAGESFTHVGLEATHHIARVLIHPTNPDVAYVAATGKLWGPSPERGLYKTTDGGESWTNTLFIDESTGFTDLIMDSGNPEVLYAASYQRQRTAWGFNGGGPGSGIWKTTDGGESWTRLSGDGLPDGELGRIGLGIAASNPDIVYAQIEVPNPNQSTIDDPDPNPSRSGVWRTTDGGESREIRSNNNNRPMYYSQIRLDPTNPDIVYTMGSPFHKSVDGGLSFEALTGIAHVDHHGLWINPDNPEHLVLGNDGGLDISWDQGDSWDFINNFAVGQFYAVGADMRRPYYVCGGLQDNGSWCGPSRSRSGIGIANHDWYNIGGGDGFYVQIDPTDFNTVYVESQGGSVSRLDLRTGQSTRIRPSAPQERDGEVTPGNVVPAPEVGERYRFNWNMPIQISPHDASTVYVAGNRFFRSTDRGTTWTASADLTRAIDRDHLEIMGVPGSEEMASKNDGQSTWGTTTTLAESPSQPGVIWVGTDDGKVQVSRNGGATFTDVSANVPGPPENYQVSRVEPSHFEPGTCYLTLDNHRYEDWNPYVFVTHDFGQSWESISNNLPRGNVNVITEDPRNPDLLYLGTEFGLFISMDRGQEWKRFQNGLATVRVDDILVHPRENDLIVANHGRSILIIDDITPLQQYTPQVAAGNAHLFEVRPAIQWLDNPQEDVKLAGNRHFAGENPPDGTAVSYYLPINMDGDVTLTITDLAGNHVRTLEGPGERGINRVQWDLRGDPPPQPEGEQQTRRRRRQPPVDPGTYLVTLEVGGREMTRSIVVEPDIWMGQGH